LIITLLGTGTSQGIPVIGCGCETCISSDQRDKRLRCSVLIQTKETTVVIDIGPDFRKQMLDSRVNHLDAVLLTHEHNDHIIGLDDLRPFLFRSHDQVLIHGEKRVLNEIKNRFEYAFVKQPYPGSPELSISEIKPGNVLKIGDLSFLPLRLIHGRLPILGFRIDSFAYLTDTNHIPHATLEDLYDLDVLVIDALRYKKHHSHFSLDESILTIAQINPKRAYLIHMSHLMGPTKVWEKSLPDNVYPSYDGMRFDL